MAWEIRFFRTRNGAYPAREFRAGLPSKLRAKLDTFAKRVAENQGKDLGPVYVACHAPFTGIFRIRAKLQQELARYFCLLDGNCLILLGGVHKRFKQPTPEAALRLAADYQTEYYETRNAD